MDKLRRFQRLPVIIEEDHNQVLEHIHRALASRHLPLSGLTFVHFDSHPDLLLPLNMPAECVFAKEELYESLSIENWILPLVYAGHVSEIYWLRPPWAHQLPEGKTTIGVGRCKDTSKLRVTCSDSYFLTEALYAPESDLLGTKFATLHVITVTPQGWDKCALENSASDCSDHRTSSVDLCSSRAPFTQLSGGCNAPSTQLSGGCCGDNLINPCSTSKSPSSDSTNCDDTPPSSKIPKLDNTTLSSNTARLEGNSSPSKTATSVKLSGGCEWLAELKEKVKNKEYILDIDLDFFSTKDPFREDCTAEEMALLRELFAYELPKDSSTEALLEFSRARQFQLDELEKAFEALQHDSSDARQVLEPERHEKFQKLITSYQKRHELSIPGDYTFLFYAGCTMDDTELPHHVSTTEQIAQLMGACQHILETLPPPTLVTMARSSLDDYCPKDQIEDIQKHMLAVLTRIYRDLDIRLEYKANADTEEHEDSDKKDDC